MWVAMASNRLKSENSVYLRQHAQNPVDWFPWGEEAFSKAKAENKIVLVSIGYSTCHWCHVMEHESFEDFSVAQYLNEHFVAIKVDREEHPDVDHFHMEALHLMSERGGWPLNMFVTPDRKPFFGGTYFPKHTFLNALQQIAKIWLEEPARILDQSTQLMDHLRNAQKQFDLTQQRQSLGLAALREIAQNARIKIQQDLLRQFDTVWGGFGSAPKFPRSHGVSALLRTTLEDSAGAHAVNGAASAQEAAVTPSTSKEAARHAALYTLRAMAYGGMRDHLAGGFHRYSTDVQWRVPHFEKMLYDQALLIQSYAEAYQISGDVFFADIVEEILNFIERDLKLESGSWAAAIDADSEGVEGKSYVWSDSEIHAIFAAESAHDLARFQKIHSISEEGNWEETNVLCTPLETEWRVWAEPKMRSMRQRLLETRSNRPQPIRDDKVIVSWNAWMVTGCLRAAALMRGRPELATRLEASASRCLKALLDVEVRLGFLPRVIYEGGRSHKGRAFFEDHAALAQALQAQAMHTGELDDFDLARKRIELIEKQFRNEAGRLNSVELSESRDSKIEDQDGATPSALSIYAGVLLRQALVESEPRWLERALQDLARLTPVLERFPIALSYLLCELDLVRDSASVVKLPRDRWAELLKALGQGETPPFELVRAWGWRIIVRHAESAIEACHFESCYLKTRDLNEALQALRSKSSKN